MTETFSVIHDGRNYIKFFVDRDVVPSPRERVKYVAKLAVDADGCNGQHDLPIAYRVDDKGTDRLVDVGYPRDPDEYSQGLICRPGTRVPLIFRRRGVEYYASRTALRMPGTDPQDPESAVDGEFYSGLVVPPQIIAQTKGVVLGSRFTAINLQNKFTSTGVVFDVGPHNKIGEGSPKLCRDLGLSGDPLKGGTEELIIAIEIEVGVPAVISGTKFVLQPH